MSRSYLLVGSDLEKCGKQIPPDWENTAHTDMAVLGSIGLNSQGIKTKLGHFEISMG